MKVACVQMTTTTDSVVNCAAMVAVLREAVAQDVAFIAFPETCNFMERGHKAMRARVQSEADDICLAALRAEAAAHKIWVSAGSLILATPEGHVVNRSLLINPQGQVVARYDKIHMFDVVLDNGERHQESAHYQAGAAAVLAKVGAQHLGMSICYDVRFGELYRAYAQAGADFLIVPSAFTIPTGQAHWHILLRARAIETGCFVLAAAQCGTHENGRRTYGHSLIIDPWGRVLAEALENNPCFITASLDFSQGAKARQQVPSLLHGRNFKMPSLSKD